MSDLWHEWGGDITVAANGDFAVSDDGELGNQRVLRRLLTNLGDYIWQLDFGAGLGGLVGQPTNATALQAMIRAQIFKEPSVANAPEPVISVQSSSLTNPGLLFVTISYTGKPSGDVQVLSFTVGG